MGAQCACWRRGLSAGWQCLPHLQALKYGCSACMVAEGAVCRLAVSPSPAGLQTWVLSVQVEGCQGIFCMTWMPGTMTAQGQSAGFQGLAPPACDAATDGGSVFLLHEKRGGNRLAARVCIAFRPQQRDAEGAACSCQRLDDPQGPQHPPVDVLADMGSPVSQTYVTGDAAQAGHCFRPSLPQYHTLQQPHQFDAWF